MADIGNPLKRVRVVPLVEPGEPQAEPRAPQRVEPAPAKREPEKVDG